MYTLITLFYISLLGIIVMLLMKRGEVKGGSRSIFSRLGSRSDRFFHLVFTAVKNVFSHINKHTFVALAHWMAFHTLKHTRNVYVEIKSRALQNPHGKKMLDAVRGRGEVKDHGASFYLRRISDISDK